MEAFWNEFGGEILAIGLLFWAVIGMRSNRKPPPRTDWKMVRIPDWELRKLQNRSSPITAWLWGFGIATVTIILIVKELVTG